MIISELGYLITNPPRNVKSRENILFFDITCGGFRYVREKYDLVILDDLGAERMSEFALQNVFNVVNRLFDMCTPIGVNKLR